MVPTVSHVISSVPPSGDSINLIRATSPSQQSKTAENCRSTAPQRGPKYPPGKKQNAPSTLTKQARKVIWFGVSEVCRNQRVIGRENFRLKCVSTSPSRGFSSDR